MTTHLADGERARIARYVTDLDGPVFALVNLPEAVKGALFARYSRSPKPLRRLLLDEFLPDDARPGGDGADEPGAERAAAFFGRVLAEYGDDSVAQLGAAHVAVEGASNVLTKVLQWGRLGSYLEQSTRYIPFTDRPGGRYRYHRPAAILADAALARRYADVLDGAFEAYGRMLPALEAWIGAGVPDDPATPAAARARAVRAAALDGLRGLLPAATTANVGVFASGQAYEAMLVRMLAHPLPEARDCGARMLRELRKVIPDFLTRVDRPDRGGAHGAYLSRSAKAAAGLARELLPAAGRAPAGPSVRLVDFDADGEARVAAHALWPASGLPLHEVRAAVAALGEPTLARVLAGWADRRGDRRERPGRALEATSYTFEVVCDYGAYRDLQRHRMLSLQAQPLGPDLGYDVPAVVAEAGLSDDYASAQEACADLARELDATLPHEAPYAVTLAHRIRFTMTLNAREAMHLVELRSQPQGHESYRAVAVEMHRQIGEVAGHRALAAMMRFVDTSVAAAGRLDAERRQEQRRSM